MIVKSTVTHTGSAKAKSVSSSSDIVGQAGSSRVSARERLQQLGIGHGTVSRFPVQALPDVGLADDHPEPDSEYPDISDIYLELDDKPAKWEKAVAEFELDSDATGARKLEADQQAAAVALSPAVREARQLAARRRQAAADQLKHFHIYAGSLIVVLLCSAWMFGFALLA